MIDENYVIIIIVKFIVYIIIKKKLNGCWRNSFKVATAGTKMQY